MFRYFYEPSKFDRLSIDRKKERNKPNVSSLLLCDNGTPSFTEDYLSRNCLHKIVLIFSHLQFSSDLSEQNVPISRNCSRKRSLLTFGKKNTNWENTRREQSSLTFFYKIHSGTVDLDKDKYLTPAPNLRRTRASHESQYTRYFAYSDALKNSFFPRTVPM